MVHVGKEGVTDSLVDSARQALSTRELIKIRVLETAPHSPRETAEHIVAEIEDAVVVQTVGYTAVIFRRHPDKPVIELPP